MKSLKTRQGNVQFIDDGARGWPTLKSLSSFPASACNSVVFPDLGGPKSKVNLESV